MYFYFVAKTLIFFLIELKGIFPAQALILENEITKPLDRWFDSIFAIDVDKVDGIIKQIQDPDLKNFEYNSGDGSISYNEWETSSAQIDFTFPTNRMRWFSKKMSLYLWGKIHAKNTYSEKKVAFDAILSIENVSLTAFASSPSQEEPNPVKTDFSYSNMLAKFKRPTRSVYPEMSNEEKNKFNREAFPLILNEFFSNNSYFYKANEMLTPFTQPRNELLSKHPEVLNNPEEFYYLITKTPFFCFTLKRIVILGLSNLDTFKIENLSSIFTHTLLVKNIVGSMILDYRSESEPPLKINFKIDHLYVMKKQKINCACVHAKYWQITRAKSNTSLGTSQSEVLMNGLESAIASSILPSMKVGKVCNLETRPESIQINNITDWKSVKEAYKGWIPFNDDTEDMITAKLPSNVCLVVERGKIGQIYVMKKENHIHNDCIRVQARNWQITRTKVNSSLNARQSEFMMNASILPSMKVEKICDTETPVKEIKITSGSDWKTVKESYKGWVPFNDDNGDEI